VKNRSSSRIVILTGFLLVTIALQGCGYLNRQFPSLGLPEYEMTPTGVGAVTGTALGGGVGALIGSASGNAGEGAFLGAASGATAGAVVGNQIHRSDQAIALQEKRVMQQRKQIEMLDRELESIRQRQGDQVVQSAYRPSYTDGTARGSLRRQDLRAGLPQNRIGAVRQERSVPVGEEFTERRVVRRSALVEETISTPEFSQPAEVRTVGQADTLGARQEARVYSTQVDNQELRNFLANVPVREARNGVEPVGVGGRQATRKVSQVVSRPSAITEVATVDTRSNVRAARLPSSPVKKYEAPAPVKPVQIVKREETVRDTGKLPSARGIVEKSIEARIPERRAVNLVNIPPAKKATSVSNTGEKLAFNSSIEPGTVRRVGTGGNIDEEKLVRKIEKPVLEKSMLEKPVPTKVVKETPVPAPVAATPSSQLRHSSPSCVEAENEAQRAREATSDADRLFYYRRALRLCGESSNYHLETGKAYASIGRVEDAAFEFRQAIDLDPNNQAAVQQLSIIEK